ncbi:MAG: S8 family serine peptidase [Bdellovibrionales bacterium]|nr:S8 family serine peptidase [Bdellovibrionales bacterium]
MKITIIAIVFSLSAIANAQEYVPGEVIVKLKSSNGSIATSAFKSKASSEKRMRLKGSWKNLNMLHYSLKAGDSVEAAISDLRNDPDVEYAEPNYIIHKSDIERGSPISEQEFRSLSSVEANGNQDGSFTQTAANIQADEAWDSVSNNGERPIVAIIDTGVDLYHSAFTRWCALWENSAEKNGTPGVDDDGNGYIDDINGYDFVNKDGSPMDDDGHGTHVSGIVLGTTQDLLAIPEVMPVAGVCNDSYKSRVRIMAVKFLDANGSGTTSDAIKAVYYAVNNGAKVLNNSWGGGSYSQSLHEAIAYAYDRKVAFIAAAGNSTSNNDIYPMFPANYDAPNMISVASSTSTDALSYFSNYGEDTVHLASPGSSIYSTFLGGTYTTMSGTSMATPFVSGVAALIAREQPGINGYQIRDILLSSATSVNTDVNGKTITGRRLNVLGAVNSAKGAVVDSSQPSYTISSSAYRGTASESAAAGCGMVSTLLNKPNGGGKGGGKGLGFAIMALLFSPALFLVARRKNANRRKHERFEVHSQMKLKVGDSELVGELESISLGGFGFDMEELIEKGSVVTVKLQTPTGEKEIEVKGKIVWRDGHHHGVQLMERNKGILQFIKQMITNFSIGKA